MRSGKRPRTFLYHHMNKRVLNNRREGSDADDDVDDRDADDDDE